MGVGDDRSGAQAGVTVAVIGGAGAMGRRICGELAINGCRVYMNGLNLGDCRNGAPRHAALPSCCAPSIHQPAVQSRASVFLCSF